MAVGGHQCCKTKMCGLSLAGCVEEACLLCVCVFILVVPTSVAVVVVLMVWVGFELATPHTYNSLLKLIVILLVLTTTGYYQYCKQCTQWRNNSAITTAATSGKKFRVSVFPALHHFSCGQNFHPVVSSCVLFYPWLCRGRPVHLQYPQVWLWLFY